MRGDSGVSMKYVRDTYGVPVKKGQTVRRIDNGTMFIVTSCTHYVHARCYGAHTGSAPILPHHPSDLEYLTDEGWWSPETREVVDV